MPQSVWQLEIAMFFRGKRSKSRVPRAAATSRGIDNPGVDARSVPIRFSFDNGAATCRLELLLLTKWHPTSDVGVWPLCSREGSFDSAARPNSQMLGTSPYLAT
jgi:hypothetical protein